MAHSKKRISIPLKPETFAAIQFLADSTGGSFGSTAGGFLDSMAPNFYALALAYEEAKTDPARAALIMQEKAIEAHQYLNQAQMDLLKSEAEKNS